MDSDGIMAAARGCVGARFRPWGREPALGLDCVGLVAHATGLAARRDYALRGGDAGKAGAALAGAGLRAVETGGAGDVLLLDEGLGQLHLAILTDIGFVHADARLRRIVETPGRPAGRIVSSWRKVG